MPQDGFDLKTFNSTRINYAVDKNGKYIATESSGWDVNDAVMHNFQGYFDELSEEAKKKFLNKESSPLEYFMYHFGLDLTTLAMQIKFSKRKIKKHFNPQIFEKLDDKTLQVYADIFRISIEEIKNFGSNENS